MENLEVKPPTYLRGELSLRTPEKSDAKELFELIDSNRAYLKRFLPWVDRTQEVWDTERFIEEVIESIQRNAGYTFLIELSGTVIGVVGQHTVDWPNKKVSLGYWLAEKYQGQGHMTRAVAWLTDFCFRAMELNRVEIRAAVENQRSQAIPLRLGFREEGVLRQNEKLGDRFVDHRVFSLLASEWKGLKD